MPLEGHWARQQTPLRRLTRREGRILAVVATALVLAAAGALLWAALSGGSSSARAGCVEVTVASTTGGARARACGAEAQHWCRSRTAGQGSFAAALRESCRRAGY
jgi:hypothetical protein